MGAGAEAPLGHVPSCRLLSRLLGRLKAPGRLLEEAARETKGVPLRLKHMAEALRTEWGRRRAIPATADLPALASEPAGLVPGIRLSAAHRCVLETLAVAGRSLRREELEYVFPRPAEPLSRSLRRLARFDLVVARGRGRDRRYRLASAQGVAEILEGTSQRAARRLHRRLAAFLEARIRRGEARSRRTRREPRRRLARERLDLARHLLAAGEQEKGRRRAIEAAERLGELGALDRAAGVLEEAARSEKDVRKRLDLADRMCSILQETGDHDQAISVLEPFRDVPLSEQDRVRVWRRLGVHCHRAGRSREALQAFRQAEKHADPLRDREELILVDCELAELHIFAGRYEAAEAACRRGLTRVAEGVTRDRDRARLEVILRASLGHIHLRRTDLAPARGELRAALRLCRRFGTPGDRAAILHNLGVTENQLNRFVPARRYFAAAERVLSRAGDRPGVVKIATNLALIAAKLGDREDALRQLERAEELLLHTPSRRPECFLAYSRGLVAHWLGDSRSAAAVLEEAISLADKLGDPWLSGFARIYRAEALLVAGRYREASSVLRRALETAPPTAPAVFHRAVQSRVFCLETILGRRGPARRARRALEQLGRTDVTFLEAWNDVFLGLGATLAGERGDVPLERSRDLFRRLGTPLGERLCRLGVALDALSRRDLETARVRFLATTSADLGELVESARFRADLLYRLAAVEIRVPSLSERPEDIPLLAEHFLKQHARRAGRRPAAFTREAANWLSEAAWPGNVRQLEALLLRVLVHRSDPSRIDVQDLEPFLATRSPDLFRRDLLARKLGDWRRDLEREYLTQLFIRAGGDTRKMLEALEVKSSRLYRWFRELGLDVRAMRRRLKDPGVDRE